MRVSMKIECGKRRKKCNALDNTNTRH